MNKKPEILQDDAWLEHHKDASAEQSPTMLLRQVMVDVESREASDVNIEHDWHRLRFALKRERPISRSAGYFAQVAMLLLLVCSVYWMMPSEQVDSSSGGSDLTRMRGKQVQEIYSKDIPADAMRLVQRLKAQGVVVTHKIQQNQAEIEVQLHYPLSPQLLNLLKSEGVDPPTFGDMKLLFLPKSSM